MVPSELLEIESESLTDQQRLDLTWAVCCSRGVKLADAQRQLQLVRMLAQQHNTPSVNPGAHALAGKILEVVG